MEKPLAAVRTPENFTFLPQLEVRLTPLGPTKMMIVHNGNLTPMSLDPSDYGIQPCNPEELAVPSKSDAVDVLKNILAGKGPRAMMEMVILNVGVAMFLLEEHMDLSVCMAKALSLIHI